MKIRSFDKTEALIFQTLELLRSALPSPGNIMLSGGSTPYLIYNQLAGNPCPVHTERKLFLSDERMQPFDSELNNAHNLEPLLEALNCKDQFIRVNTCLPRTEAAEQFAEDLYPLKKIDLGFLGLGDDGHTAGLFTPKQARVLDQLTLDTDRPDGMEGISVTPAFLQRVKKIILLVTGEPKRETIHTLLNDPQSIAAGIALSKHPNCELWTDLQMG